jgi:hypothetical protein
MKKLLIILTMLAGCTADNSQQDYQTKLNAVNALIAEAQAQIYEMQAETNAEQEINNLTSTGEIATEGIIISEPTPEVKPPEPVNDLAFVTKWKGANISKWEVTSNLTVKVSGDKITMSHSKQKEWPTFKSANNNLLNGNCWVIYDDGKDVIASSWEWLGKSTKTTETARIYRCYADITGGKVFDPKKIRTWIFISGLIRDSHRNVSERSNIVEVKL